MSMRQREQRPRDRRPPPERPRPSVPVEVVLDAQRRALAAFPDVEVLEESYSSNLVLRLVLDRAGAAVDAALLTAVLIQLRRELRAANLDPGDFRLEVDSPGERRLLTNSRQFELYRGQRVRVHFAPDPSGPKPPLIGTLVAVEDGRPRVRADDGSEQLLGPGEYRQIRLEP